jgi:hypothetical protein
MIIIIIFYFIPMVWCCYEINKYQDINISPKKYLINLMIPFIPILNLFFLLEILLNEED